MKYNVLIKYRESLHAAAATSTADTYYKAMSWLLNDQHILDCRKLDIDMVMNKLESIKHKNTYSKHKNAFLKFCTFVGVELPPETLQRLKDMNADKKKKRRKLKPVTLKSINDHIRVIRDKKLKLSFQTMLNSGLRVSELDQIKKGDSTIYDDYIEFHFVGKGGNYESVSIFLNENSALFKNLIELINATPEGQKLFYSKSYLQEQATKRGFQCHDLRRACAKITFKKTGDKKKVQERLRHAKMRNTKLYLNSKVKI